MRLFPLTAAALCALAWAGVAQAGTVSVSGDDVTFVAAPSEVNRVVVAFEEDPVRGVRVVDIGAKLTAGAGCSSLNDFGGGATNLVGGPGRDVLKSIGFQDSELHGGDGNDTLIGGNGAQFFDGGKGNDLLRGGPGTDRLTGGDGADELVGGRAKDQMRGRSGNDTLRSKDAFKDLVYGNQGTDRAHVDGRDILAGIEELF
jgi:Ca2+-binding RTX toxin-like protein